MRGHTKVAEEVLPWGCYYGECDHEGDCPTQAVEACSGCSGPGEFEGDRYTVIVPWETAERDQHQHQHLEATR